MSGGPRWDQAVVTAYQRKRELERHKGAPVPRDVYTHWSCKLPFPPAVNHSHELNANGSRRLSDEARAFRENAVAIARMSFQQAGYQTLHGKVSVGATFAPPDARKRDIDGPLKQLLDALQEAAIFADDAQVKHLEATLMDPMFPGEGSVMVVVRTM